MNKRKFDEISNEPSITTDDQGKSTKFELLYGNETKKRKLDQQKIGDFIVDAKNSFNFRLSSNINQLEDPQSTTSFFSPQFMHWMFGQDERISGYEGLSVDITLSKKRLIPFLQITYRDKAPAFANIDNIQEKLQKHYGRIYEKTEDYIKLLQQEQEFKPQGQKIDEAALNDGQMVSIYKISLDDETFHEQNYYMQSLLPFFIDGASVIEPSPFWSYFLVYDSATNDMLAFATVFEAHLSADRFRAKISQVLVLPPYQKKGLGQKLYQTIYNHYRKDQPKCFQIIVEDASDDFQRVQDLCNVQTFLLDSTVLRTQLKAQPIQNLIINEQSLKQLQLNRANTQELANKLKLPDQIILRLNELALYSFLSDDDLLQRAYRIIVKKRYYLRCVRDYLQLFKSSPFLDRRGGLKEPYIYNDQMEESPFYRAGGTQHDKIDGEEQKEDKEGGGMGADQVILQEGVKIQLNTIYGELISQFRGLKPKVRQMMAIAQ